MGSILTLDHQKLSGSASAISDEDTFTDDVRRKRYGSFLISTILSFLVTEYRCESECTPASLEPFFTEYEQSIVGENKFSVQSTSPMR